MKKGLCRRHFQEQEKHGKPAKKKQTCKVADCPMGPIKDGLCTGHFKEKNGKPLPPKKKKTCKVKCSKWAVKEGMCTRHSKDPNAPIRKPCKASAEEQPAAKKMKMTEDLSLSNAADAGMEEEEDLTLSDLMATATQVALV